MENRFKILCLLAFIAGSIQAQEVKLSGRVVDSDKTPIEQATVQLLQLPDSTYIQGAATNADGNWSIAKTKKGHYLLKVTYIGMKTNKSPLYVTGKNSNQSIPTIELATDAVMLQEAVVTAEAAQVEAKEDTLVYNAETFRTQKGAMLEDLIKRIPGAEVSDDGTVTVNGETIKKIMVDGKEYFSNNSSIALKNLPANAIKNIKTYSKQSDMTKLTGIDDGNDETVLDLTIKQGMKKGLFANTDVAAGTENRYLAKGMLNSFKDDKQLSAIINMNNIGDAGYGGVGFHRFQMAKGLEDKKSAGLHIAKDWEKVKFGGSVDYTYDDKDNKNSSTSETYLQQGSQFGRSSSISRNQSDNVNADFRVEWTIDDMTSLYIIPSASYNKSKTISASKSLVSNEALTNSFIKEMNELETDSLYNGLVNQQMINSQSNNESYGADVDVQFNRRLSDNGRNINLRMRYGIDHDSNDGTSLNQIVYYNGASNDESKNVYYDNLDKSYNYQLQASYSEPIGEGLYLQGDYTYDFKHSDYDIQRYNNDDSSNRTLIADESRSFDNDYTSQKFRLGIRKVTKSLNFTLGMDFFPQTSSTKYESDGTSDQITKKVYNWTPYLELKKDFSKTHGLNFQYKGRTSMPSMSNLSPIPDTSNPLYIRNGNPSLKPSMDNSLRLRYHYFNPTTQSSIFGGAFGSVAQNDISLRTVYDTETGIRETTPENINGNWNIRSMVGFNTPLFSKKFTVSNMFSPSYSEQNSFLQSEGTTIEAEKNSSNSFGISDRLRFGFREDNWDVAATGTLNYQKLENSLSISNNRETYEYGFGGETNITLPYNWSLSTDMSVAIRRGYDAGLNNEQLVWNAQVSKSFGNLTFMLQGLDLLEQKTNIMSQISNNMRTDSEYNAVNSYFMLHVTYQFNLFGGKDPNANRDQRGPGRDGPGGRGSRGGGRHPF
ncbi:MAG: TonB-dependent receptor [Bacteroidaceae bacterium]